jgi:hypothetical protein
MKTIPIRINGCWTGQLIFFWNNTVLFVGYGLRDEHVRRLLARIRRERGDWARKAYAVGYYDQVRTRTLLKKNIEVLPYDAEVFLPALVERALGVAFAAGQP